MPALDVIYFEPTLRGESDGLADSLRRHAGAEGTLILGYPTLAGDLPQQVDAVLVTPTHGLIAFLFEGARERASVEETAFQVHQVLSGRLRAVKALRRRLELLVKVGVVVLRGTAEGVDEIEPGAVWGCSLKGLPDLLVLASADAPLDADQFRELQATVQEVRALRRPTGPPGAQGSLPLAKVLAQMSEQVSSLDRGQLHGALEMVDGPQRIRGLAGSGKTVVLARKAAALHLRHPEAKIAVVHFTRALGPQLDGLIGRFLGDESRSVDRLSILPAWGGKQPGCYSRLAEAAGQYAHTVSSAKQVFGASDPFGGACDLLATWWEDHPEAPRPFDWILVDEAQDLPIGFFRLLWRATEAPHRIVFAYDELQSLQGDSLPAPDQLFGVAPEVVPLRNPERGPLPDVVLSVCYRTSPWALAAAHGLGLGVHAPQLVQWVDRRDLWEAVGYDVQGEWEEGKLVRLSRRDDAAPSFFRQYLRASDAVSWRVFSTVAEQDEELVKAIAADIRIGGLRPEEVLVIFVDPGTYKTLAAGVQYALSKAGLGAQVAGEDRGADTFAVAGSVTLSGIHRAKGNEAGMVYIVGAGLGEYPSVTERNRIFTAITRSKAWVRIWGVGKRMDALAAELIALRDDGWTLSLKVPTEREKRGIRLLGRDLSTDERRVRDEVDRLGHDLQSRTSEELSRIFANLRPEVREALTKMAGKTP